MSNQSHVGIAGDFLRISSALHILMNTPQRLIFSSKPFSYLKINVQVCFFDKLLIF